VPEKSRRRSQVETPASGVRVDPGVCGGLPCIAGTRIPIWVLERARQLGASERKLLQMYPMLGSCDLDNAWLFVEQYRDVIERQIKDNESFP
jgi:uncharacterized protein (DUF433 family)